MKLDKPLAAQVHRIAAQHHAWKEAVAQGDDPRSQAALDEIKGAIEEIWRLKPAESCTKIPCSICGQCFESDDLNWQEEGYENAPLCGVCAEEVQEDRQVDRFCSCDDPLGAGLHKCPDCGKFYSREDELSEEAKQLFDAIDLLISSDEYREAGQVTEECADRLDRAHQGYEERQLTFKN